MNSFFGNGFFDGTAETYYHQFPPSQPLGEAISSQGLGSYVYPMRHVEEDNRIAELVIQRDNINRDDQLKLKMPGYSNSKTYDDGQTWYHCNFQAAQEGYGSAYAAEYFGELKKENGKFNLKNVYKLESDEEIQSSCKICDDSNGIRHPALRKFERKSFDWRYASS